MNSQHKIGLFGGSFDPIHLAHLNIAKELYATYNVDLIYFIPAAHSPLKKTEPIVDDHHRLSMLRLALQDYPPFDALDWELQQGGQSYSINTVKYIKSKASEAELFWLIGQDQVHQLHRWHRIEELAKLVTFIAAQRPPHTCINPPNIPHLKLEWLLTHKSTISSTEIRAKLKKNESVDFLLPKSVYQYIDSHKLYK